MEAIRRPAYKVPAIPRFLRLSFQDTLTSYLMLNRQLAFAITLFFQFKAESYGLTHASLHRGFRSLCVSIVGKI